MKGYKATKNMKCLTLTYEVGKTCSIDNTSMCNFGFHFCEKMADVLDYYSFGENFVLLEVEALGVVERKGNKSLTDKLKVIRVVPKDEYVGFPVKEYDTNGNLIHYKNSDVCEEWKEYDANGNLIHYKDSDGREEWKEYDTAGNIIHYKKHNGYEYWDEYDTAGNLIHHKDSDGDEYWKEYDANGNLIHYKKSSGGEWRITISI